MQNARLAHSIDKEIDKLIAIRDNYELELWEMLDGKDWLPIDWTIPDKDTQIKRNRFFVSHREYWINQLDLQINQLQKWLG
jgi:hypothetical protein